MVSESAALRNLANYHKCNARNPNLFYNGVRIPDAKFQVGSQVWYYSCDDDVDIENSRALITEGPVLYCRMVRILGHDQHIWHTYCVRYMDATDATKQPQEMNLIEVTEIYL
ncbi:uncharacterized protein Bfra_008028 [Botrytis fragariae]|uniref:Uncharacterized protein n=1 Tax=Botrytis fragariae TaxID=1964551 RepID=A0A8H6APY3_9HELO|nr:uncharacterized protein Bfra_008028 [Botrytis fragariae]KAF5871509.1 hypothetical protein Bfra_008028 [Botrytis fragariae]